MVAPARFRQEPCGVRSSLLPVAAGSLNPPGKVGPVEAPHDPDRVLETERGLDLRTDPGRGRGGQGQNRHRNLGSDLPDAEVGGPEVVAPLADAVGFVHCDQRHGEPGESRSELRDMETLGRNQQELDTTGLRLLQDPRPARPPGGRRSGARPRAPLSEPGSTWSSMREIRGLEPGPSREGGRPEAGNRRSSLPRWGGFPGRPGPPERPERVAPGPGEKRRSPGERWRSRATRSTGDPGIGRGDRRGDRGSGRGGPRWVRRESPRRFAPGRALECGEGPHRKSSRSFFVPGRNLKTHPGHEDHRMASEPTNHGWDPPPSPPGPEQLPRKKSRIFQTRWGSGPRSLRRGEDHEGLGVLPGQERSALPPAGLGLAGLPHSPRHRVRHRRLRRGRPVRTAGPW